MPENNVYYLIYPSIHDVLKVEKILKKQSVTFKLVPVPRSLSSDCGICIMLKQDIKEVLPILKDDETGQCFFFDGKTYEPVALKL